MIQINSIKKGATISGDYLIDDEKTYFKLLPYLYRKLEGEWEIALVDIPLKTALKVLDDTTLPEYVKVNVYLAKDDFEQLLLERPHAIVEEIPLYEQYLQLFKEFNKIFDPRAVKEIYYRSGRSIDALRKSLTEVVAVAEGEKVTVTDVDKVLIKDNRVFASDVIRAFLAPKKERYRWRIYNRFVTDLGRDYAYYTLRKYVRRLLLNKNKYLLNERVEDRFSRDVREIDAYKIDHAFIVFTKYDKPELLPAAIACLERRTL